MTVALRSIYHVDLHYYPGAMTVTPSDFAARYKRRIYKYVAGWVKRWRLPRHMTEDLVQACWLVIPRQLASWDPNGGKSAYNWCVSRMKREMTAEYRRYHGNPGYGWRRVPRYTFVSNDGRICVDAQPDRELTIDIKTHLAKMPNSRNLERFLRNAVQGASGSEMALESGQTRQAVNHALRQTRLQLAPHFDVFAEECPSDAPTARRSCAYPYSCEHTKNDQLDAY